MLLLFSICLRFSKVGEVETVHLSKGNFLLRLWGGMGGNSSEGALGGRGAYVETIMTLKKEMDIYVHVGSAAKNEAKGQYYGGNGVKCSASYSGGGGSSSDIRLTEFNDRIVVAAGGSGASGKKPGYPGGDLNGIPANLCNQTYGGDSGYGGASAHGCNCRYKVSGGGGGYRGGNLVNQDLSACQDDESKIVSSSGCSHIYTYPGAEVKANPPTGWSDDISFYHPQAKLISGENPVPLPEGDLAVDGHVIIEPIDFFQKPFDCKKEETPYRFFGEALIEKVKHFFMRE